MPLVTALTETVTLFRLPVHGYHHIRDDRNRSGKIALSLSSLSFVFFSPSFSVWEILKPPRQLPLLSTQHRHRKWVHVSPVLPQWQLVWMSPNCSITPLRPFPPPLPRLTSSPPAPPHLLPLVTMSDDSPIPMETLTTIGSPVHWLTCKLRALLPIPPPHIPCTPPNPSPLLQFHESHSLSTTVPYPPPPCLLHHAIDVS